MFFGSESLSSAHPQAGRRVKISSTFWDGEDLYTLLKCCCKEDLSLYVHLVVYSFTYISVWTHVYLFYTLGYNPIEFYLFFCLNCSSFSHWELFHVGSCVSLTHPHLTFNLIFIFWSTSLFTHTTRYSGHPLYFPCSSPRDSHFFKEPQFLLLENSI